MSDLILIPDGSPKDAPGTDTGYGRQPLGMSKSDCQKQAEEQGGVAWDEHAQACWNIFGKAVIIGPDEHSVEEGFKVVNFNFNTNGDQPPAPTQASLPGPSNVGQPAMPSDYKGGV